MRTATLIVLFRALALGLFFRNYTGGARSADTLEDAVDYCADCGARVHPGDYLCDDCC